MFSLKRCIGCAHCGVYCPENVFALELLDPHGIDSADLMNLLKSRRSVRKYSDKEISSEVIEELLAVIAQSPTGVNAQGISVAVINGKDSVHRLLVPIRNFLRIIRFTGIPALLGKLTGTTRFLRNFQMGTDPIFRSAPAVLFFYSRRNSPTGRSDAIIAATLTMVHARTLGLDTLWNGIALAMSRVFPLWLRNTVKGAGKLYAVLCVGYPELKLVCAAPDREYETEGTEPCSVP